MARTFISPAKYCQGPGEMKNLGTYSIAYGKKALIVISTGGARRHGDMIRESFTAAGTAPVFELFNGECCRREINRMTHIVRKNGIDVVIGIGGGKIFDTAKAVAFFTDLPVIICPTVAATDAPCSALSVLYTDEGTVESYLHLKSNPALVLMDSEIIAASPVRLTISGMGDALSTYYEARAAHMKDCANDTISQITHTALALAELCCKLLYENGPQARQALEANELTPAVEAVIEANTLLSGLGFENCGTAAAHAIHDGLCSLPECRHMYHGEKVAFGVIAQLVLEKAPHPELERVLDFCTSVGLPVTLAEIGIAEPAPEKIMQIAAIACSETESIRSMPFDVTPETVAEAIVRADALGRAALAARR